MDIYQCMHCGERWSHGGMRESFVRAAQHADETRGTPEGMHLVLVGDMDRLAEQRKQYLAGEPLVMPNDREVSAPPMPMPELPERNLSAFAHELGIKNIDEARLLIRKLFESEKGERPLPESSTDDIIPAGKIEMWGNT